MKLILLLGITIMFGIIGNNFHLVYGQEMATDDFLPPMAPNDFELISPPDFKNGANFSTIAKLVAEDIRLYDENEIEGYPLAELSSNDIESVFIMLDSGNISKLLLNLNLDTVKEVKNKISIEEFDNILNKLSNETKNLINERIQSGGN